MEIIKKKVSGIINDVRDLVKNNEFTQSDLNQAPSYMVDLYDQLAQYYLWNPSMWSNFRSLWKKLHKYLKIIPGKKPEPNNRAKCVIAYNAVAAATASKEYGNVKKGMIFVLRKPNLNQYFYNEYQKTKNNKPTLSGAIKIKNPNWEPKNEEGPAGSINDYD